MTILIRLEIFDPWYIEREKRIEEDNKETLNYNIWNHLKDEVPLFCQVEWENDIIWTPEDVNKKRTTG